MEYKIGTRIYYTGDMANIDGHGVIFAIRTPTRWQGLSYDVRLDDGREFLAVVDFDGYRFMTHDAWQAKRDAQIAEMRRRYCEE